MGLPTGAADVAEAILGIAHQLLINPGTDAWGTYHFAGRGSTNWCDFAEAIFERAEPFWRRRPQVTPIATADYPTPARRPLASVLDCTRFDRTFLYRAGRGRSGWMPWCDLCSPRTRRWCGQAVPDAGGRHAPPWRQRPPPLERPDHYDENNVAVEWPDGADRQRLGIRTTFAAAATRAAQRGAAQGWRSRRSRAKV